MCSRECPHPPFVTSGLWPKGSVVPLARVPVGPAGLRGLSSRPARSRRSGSLRAVIITWRATGSYSLFRQLAIGSWVTAAEATLSDGEP